MTLLTQAQKDEMNTEVASLKLKLQNLEEKIQLAENNGATDKHKAKLDAAYSRVVDRLEEIESQFQANERASLKQAAAMFKEMSEEQTKLTAREKKQTKEKIQKECMEEIYVESERQAIVEEKAADAEWLEYQELVVKRQELDKEHRAAQEAFKIAADKLASIESERKQVEERMTELKQPKAQPKQEVELVVVGKTPAGGVVTISKGGVEAAKPLPKATKTAESKGGASLVLTVNGQKVVVKIKPSQQAIDTLASATDRKTIIAALKVVCAKDNVTIDACTLKMNVKTEVLIAQANAILETLGDTRRVKGTEVKSTKKETTSAKLPTTTEMRLVAKEKGIDISNYNFKSSKDRAACAKQLGLV